MSNMPKTIGENSVLSRLEAVLRRYKGAAVAYSGGVDSSLLLWACTRVFPQSNIQAITFYSDTTPRLEMAKVRETIAYLQVNHLWLAAPEMEDKDFTRNDLLRCYYCKRKRFKFLLENYGELAGTIMEGSHLDDHPAERPGMKALAELRIASPLREANLGRRDILNICREYNLPFLERPTESCLATRIRTGQSLEPDLLSRIDHFEEEIKNLGCSLVRARYNLGEIRLEVLSQDQYLIIQNRRMIGLLAQKHGFDSVSLDLYGYGELE